MSGKNYSMCWNEKRKYWIASFKRSNGSWGTKFCPKEYLKHHEMDAERWLIGWLAAFHEAETFPPEKVEIKAAPKSIAYLAPKWLNHRCRDLRTARNTYLGFVSSVSNWILDNPKFKHAKIQDLDIEQELTVQVLLTWIYSMSGAASSKLSHISTLKSLINDSIALDWLDANTANPLDRPAIRKIMAQLKDERVESNVNAHLTSTQVDQLLNGENRYLNDYRKGRYIVAIYQGFRDSELQALTWGDVHWKDQVIVTNKQLQKIGCAPCIHERDLKVPKDEIAAIPNAIVGKPKSSDSVREVPLHPLTLEFLKHWFKKGWQLYTGKIPTKQDPIFPRGSVGRSDVGKPGDFCFSESPLLLRKDLDRLGLPTTFTDRVKGLTVDLTFHRLRGTFAYLLEQGGADELQIGALMGHKGKSVTRQEYMIGISRAVSRMPAPATVKLQYTTLQIGAEVVDIRKKTAG